MATFKSPAPLAPYRKRKRAVAIRYQAGDVAPQVIAKGKGVVAENLIAKAKSEGIETHQNADLVAELTKTEIGTYIPEALYHAVAQVLVFINDLDAAAGNRHYPSTTQKEISNDPNPSNRPHRRN